MRLRVVHVCIHEHPVVCLRAQFTDSTIGNMPSAGDKSRLDRTMDDSIKRKREAFLVNTVLTETTTTATYLYSEIFT